MRAPQIGLRQKLPRGGIRSHETLPVCVSLLRSRFSQGFQLRLELSAVAQEHKVFIPQALFLEPVLSEQSFPCRLIIGRRTMAVKRFVQNKDCEESARLRISSISTSRVPPPPT